ncbi:MAG: 4-hydroxy-3-methylbut-2-enyl diphosphate reductase [Treponema sp.]|nr:4-hydroxy-3-methylbut-2-enyl diphosphate reductase [Treponema sp.]
MTVIRADVLGYCMGVRRAVDLAERAVAAGGTVLSLGPLIHNAVALMELEQRGLSVVPADALAAVPRNSTVVIRAHGVPPAVPQALSERSCTVVDATCPFVMRSQKIAVRFSEDGWTVILAGQKNHGEVIGIAGYAGERFILVQNRAEAALLPPGGDGERAVLLAQSTFPAEEFRGIADVVKKKYAVLRVIDTLCAATYDRQESLKRLCPLVDGVLVIGGKLSANTAQLFATAQLCCRYAALIETAAEIPPVFFSLETVGLSAGASTPDSVIDAVERRLQSTVA